MEQEKIPGIPNVLRKFLADDSGIPEDIRLWLTPERYRDIDPLATGDCRRMVHRVPLPDPERTGLAWSTHNEWSPSEINFPLGRPIVASGNELDVLNVFHQRLFIDALLREEPVLHSTVWMTAEQEGALDDEMDSWIYTNFSTWMKEVSSYCPHVCGIQPGARAVEPLFDKDHCELLGEDGGPPKSVWGIFLSSGLNDLLIATKSESGVFWGYLQEQYIRKLTEFVILLRRVLGASFVMPLFIKHATMVPLDSSREERLLADSQRGIIVTFVANPITLGFHDWRGDGLMDELDTEPFGEGEVFAKVMQELRTPSNPPRDFYRCAVDMIQMVLPTPKYNVPSPSDLEQEVVKIKASDAQKRKTMEEARGVGPLSGATFSVRPAHGSVDPPRESDTEITPGDIIRFFRNTLLIESVMTRCNTRSVSRVVAIDSYLAGAVDDISMKQTVDLWGKEGFCDDANVSRLRLYFNHSLSSDTIVGMYVWIFAWSISGYISTSSLYEVYRKLDSLHKETADGHHYEQYLQATLEAFVRVLRSAPAPLDHTVIKEVVKREAEKAEVHKECSKIVNKDGTWKESGERRLETIRSIDNHQLRDELMRRYRRAAMDQAKVEAYQRIFGKEAHYGEMVYPVASVPLDDSDEEDPRLEEDDDYENTDEYRENMAYLRSRGLCMGVQDDGVAGVVSIHPIRGDEDPDGDIEM